MADGQAQKNTDFNQSQRNNPSRVGQVRREEKRQINTDWQYLQKKNLGNNASSDQLFNESYQKQGLQPQDLNQANSDHEEVSNKAQDRSSYQSKYSSKRRGRRIKSLAESLPEQNIGRRARALQSLKNIKSNRFRKSVLKNVKLVKGTATIGSILILYFKGYLIQLAGAVLSILGFGIMAAQEDSILIDIGTSLTGLGDSGGILFVTGYLIVIAIGGITISLLYFIYIFTLTKPLSGKNAGLKISLVLLSIICYATPVVNLFPVTLLWILVVRKYPE